MGVYDHNQTFVPDSFIALYLDARRRLTASREVLSKRHELCEDMACMLTEHCQQIHFRDGVDEAEVLARCLKGLQASPAQVSPAEAVWVMRRTAELLGWSWQPPGDPPDDTVSNG